MISTQHWFQTYTTDWVIFWLTVIISDEYFDSILWTNSNTQPVRCHHNTGLKELHIFKNVIIYKANNNRGGQRSIPGRITSISKREGHIVAICTWKISRVCKQTSIREQANQYRLLNSYTYVYENWVFKLFILHNPPIAVPLLTSMIAQTGLKNFPSMRRETLTCPSFSATVYLSLLKFTMATDKGKKHSSICIVLFIYN